MFNFFYEKIYRNWIYALKRETKNIFYNFGISLNLPNINVEDVTSRWGRYDPLTKTVYISKKLIENYSWDSVVETLKHELAHFLVEELYKVSEVPHGKAFREACIKIGASNKARANDADIGEPLDLRDNVKIKENSLHSKIKKLFALSSSLNENESNEALKKANELILKYNINCDENNHSAEYEYKVIVKKTKKIQSEELMILNILNEFFFIEYIIIPYYSPLNDNYVSALEFIGKPENIEMSEYIYNFLKRKCDDLWNEHKLIYGSKGKREKKSFLIGVLDGFKKTLISLVKESNCHALIESRHKELVKFLKFRHPRIRKVTKNGIIVNPTAYSCGENAGKKIRINPALKHTTKMIESFY